MSNDNHDVSLTIDYLPPKSGVRGTLVASLPNDEQVVEKADICDSNARTRFADKVCQDRAGLDHGEVLRQLDTLAGLQAKRLADAATEKSDPTKSFLPEDEGFELFHDADGEAFARIPVRDHFEVWKVRSKGFRQWVGFRYYTQTQESMPAQDMTDLMNTLAGRALYEGPEHPIALRIAKHESCVWLDLGDAEWNAVCIDGISWRMVQSKDVPVRFVRRQGMQPLPVPVPGGSINELRPFVNLDDDQFTLAMGWLIGAFRPDGPYGVLAISGEHGSAKSTTSKLLRRLIDPNRADMRRPPKSERDAFISASNSWIVTCNNVSSIKPEISDALCALATDGGFSTRALYENDEESIFDVRRPVILNGIDEPASRSDLVDRCISLFLRRITETQRLDEAEVVARFEQIQPRVLGALLTAVSAAIRNRSSVRLPRKPRMADLATWATAAEPAFGWRPGQFLDAYMGNRDEAQLEVIDSSPIGPVILKLVEQAPMVGTATELLELLNRSRGTGEPPADWPQTGKGLGSMLRRLAPNLRAVGLEVELPKKGRGTGRDKKCVFRIEQGGTERSAWSARAADRPERSAPKSVESGTVRSGDITNRIGDAPDGVADLADHADRCVRPLSVDRDKETVGGPLIPDTAKSTGRKPCRACGHDRWWRTRDTDENSIPTCGSCHEPAPGRTDIVWLDGAKRE